MKILEYEHSTVVLEKDGCSLVIDAGSFAEGMPIPGNVVGVIVTHEHQDHFDAKLVDALLLSNPDARLYGTSAVAKSQSRGIEIVGTDMNHQIGPFDVCFSVGKHAVVHPGLPLVDNMAVTVDSGVFHYSGDSLALPRNRHIEVLAVPAAGPWMKLGEVVDFIQAVSPAIALPVHDAHLSWAGHELADGLLASVASRNGRYVILKRGESMQT